MALLPEGEIAAALDALPGWSYAGGALHRTYRFESYLEGVFFANRVAGAAEVLDHHPDLLISYRSVAVRLTSHDSGGVTSRDIRMAGRVESLASGG